MLVRFLLQSQQLLAQAARIELCLPNNTAISANAAVSRATNIRSRAATTPISNPRSFQVRIIAFYHHGFHCKDSCSDWCVFGPGEKSPSLTERRGAARANAFQGFEAIKQLLEQSQAYKVILGARNTKATQEAYDGLDFNRDSNSVSISPLELADLKGVKTFAEKTLEKLGQDKIDYLLLNAAISKGAEEPGPNGSKWCESYIVNHLCECSWPRT